MTTEPIDLPSALERVGGDREFLDSLLDIYQEDFADKHGRLREAVGRKDFAEIREVGHSLKGASANLSLLPLQDACFRMEKAGRDQDLQQAQEALSLMDREFQKLQEYLTAQREHP